MNHTFGYILCCQSPALFLLAIALVIFFFVRRGRARIRAVLSLLAAIVCIALGVAIPNVFFRRFIADNRKRKLFNMLVERKKKNGEFVDLHEVEIK